MKKISVLGLGYVGLPTALILAEVGFEVKGYDINHDLIQSINNNSFNSEEPNLNNLLKTVKKENKFTVSNLLTKADIYIICVPTPKKEKRSDLSFVQNSINLIANTIEENSIVIIESTIPIGTTKNCANTLLKYRKDLNKEKIYFAHCPERVFPGNAISEIKNNDRVIGGINKESTELAVNIYEKFSRGKIFKTSSNTAEMIKLSENTYRDVNIALANELSLIAEKNEIDIKDVIELANKHPRVNIHKPGIGVGGHCIPVDPYFLIENVKYKKSIISMSREVNINQESHTLKKILAKILKNKDKENIYFYGLTYKANVGDFRESPALRILKDLSKINLNKQLFAIDPFLKEEKHEGNISFKRKVFFQNNSLIFIMICHLDFENYINTIDKNKQNIEIIDLT